MKKTLMFLVMGIAVSASAVTVKWIGNNNKTRILGLTSTDTLTTGSGSETASIVVYFLQYSNWSTVSTLKNQSEESFLKAVTPYQSTVGQQGSNAALSGLIVATTGEDATYPSSDVGASFFGRMYATLDGSVYYMNLFGGTGTDDVWTGNTTGNATITEKFGYAERTYGGSTSTVATDKNVWIKVPEPATAALALLGVGMLIRRRRRA